jgi:hypothetical protein
MNQLVTREQIDLLPVSQQSFVRLRLANKAVKDISQSTLKISCAEILTKASFDMGSPMADDEQVLEFQTLALVNELKGKYGTLTLPEVAEAFTRGIRGETGPYFGMCPKTYHQFLKWFYELPERGKAWIDYLALLEKGETADKPKVFTREYLVHAAKTAFEDYKTSGKLPMVPFAIYDTIKDLKGVKSLMSIKDWPNIQSEAQQSYTEERTRGLRKDKVAQVISELIFSQENRGYEFHLKKIGLKYYFDELIREGKGLEI